MTIIVNKWIFLKVIIAQKQETLRKKSNKIYARSICGKLQNTNEGNQRRPKQMERYTMLMNSKTQYKFSKLTYKFNAIQMKISANIFVEIDKQILKFMWKNQRN